LRRREHAEWKSNKGIVLVVMILWAFAAFSCAALILAVANVTAEEHRWQTDILTRENVALQASALVEDWFLKNLDSGSLLAEEDFDIGAAPRDDPYIDVPDEVLAKLRELNPRIEINAIIIDQNYSSAIASSMDKLETAYSAPFNVEVSCDAGDACTYCAKYFQITVSAAFKGSLNNRAAFVKNFLVLRKEDGTYKAICTCTKKQ